METFREYSINYGFGLATMITPRDLISNEDIEWQFMDLANQCFGIRKSVMSFEVLSTVEVPRPKWWPDGAHESLKHSGGDLIIWGADGEKIKSEWD